MSIEIIKTAVEKGAKVYASVSGGKDSQAMVKVLVDHGFKIEGLIHSDLGSVEWKESITMCEKLAAEFSVPLFTRKRTDGKGLEERWEDRMIQLEGTGKPFWSSSSNRYCTSDLKRDVINIFLVECGHDLIINCAGIRADESTARAKKNPLAINTRKSSKVYEGMEVEEAISNFQKGKRLVIDWYPIFNFSTADVWMTYNMTESRVNRARQEYQDTKQVPAWWPFHPAYAYGNQRVSCMFCVLGCQSDLQNAAKHNPELLTRLIAMEEKSGATFKNNWSLKSLLK